ncbi:uncharacterized protein LOC103712111 isoform X2 [Phoenix dactylifera]|uniref:Uncharacterized protein LOC103712111 isoform X2 n=1 Tax=Phoenix dactylifera TaxID=42345 RepID=A0A8B9A204_PHODC|nr:uncharacterized protein LOC103712111 isoform X2 [Phoenix dactylifera]
MPLCIQTVPVPAYHQTLAPISPKGFVVCNPKRPLHVLRSKIGGSIHLRRKNHGTKIFLGCNGLVSANDALADDRVKKRNIVEHIFLLRAKSDLSDVEEKDMLDHLYTSQYQMSGIIAISLGCIEDPNVDNFTHAVYMRFQKKEDIARFYVNSYYSRVLKEHVTPYCYGSVSVDYESEVEDDILSIFRRGEEFNHGVECILLISIFDTAPGDAIEDALATLQNLILQFRPFIVQATQGYNLKLTDSEYTHGAVIRFPSFEALEAFRESTEYKDMWRLKFRPIIRKAVLTHFSVDPVGTELM